jgi:O-antigen/teichoic acid export membrane protein
MTDRMKREMDASPGANDPIDDPTTESGTTKTLKSQLLGGSLTLLAGSGLVGVTNLLSNVLTARLLGPAGFGHATAVYTILMLMSCITLSFQIITAKYISRSSSVEERAAVFASLHRRSWMVGVATAILLYLFQHALTVYLSLPDPLLISLLALGTAFYIPLGVRRGYIQGIHAFRPLAFNFMLEGLVRLAGLYLLIGLGMGVRGAVLASVIAVIVCYFAALPSPGLASLGFRGATISFREGLQAIVFFSGQTIINNFDIVLVKHFFPPAEAGFYAAIALVGRLVNMCAWSVVHTMFPVSAGTNTDEREGQTVLFMSLSLVSAILTVLVTGLWIVPNVLWKGLFGRQFDLGNYGSLAPLLILYAVAAGVYSLSSVIITYEMSRKIANTSWIQLAFSGVLALGVYVFHDTLRQVILVQLILMVILLAVLVIPLLARRLQPPTRRAFTDLRLGRSLSEDEVMAEFLKSEFHHAEFDEYRSQFDRVVQHPDLNNSRENEARRALLFLRRGSMWRELPADTKWFEVELTMDDLKRIRFFPRAHWRKVASDSFYLVDVVERIRLKLEAAAQGEFFNKLRLLSYSAQDNVNRTVILIGADEQSPLTILDGNHRMAAAMLSQPDSAVQGFRFLCGLSPEMIRCCWYHTNFTTLFRYFGNLLRHFSYQPNSDIGRFQQSGL